MPKRIFFPFSGMKVNCVDFHPDKANLLATCGEDSEVNIFARITSYAQAKPPKFPYPAEFPGATAEFVDNLLEPNPTKRMGARGAGWEEIKMQPWFAGFNWQGLATGSLLSPVAHKLLVHKLLVPPAQFATSPLASAP